MKTAQIARFSGSPGAPFRADCGRTPLPHSRLLGGEDESREGIAAVTLSNRHETLRPPRPSFRPVIETVRLLLVEDDAMVRGWMRLTLQGSEFRVVAETASAAEAVDLCARCHPQLLLVDHRLGNGSGTELVRGLRHSGQDVPAVLMTANAEAGFNELARDAGAQGTTLKTGRADELLRTLRLVAARHSAFDSRFPRRSREPAALTPREREVLRLIAAGGTNREIAESLGIAPATVKTLLARTFVKLDVHRRAEAVAIAHKKGILSESASHGERSLAHDLSTRLPRGSRGRSTS